MIVITKIEIIKLFHHQKVITITQQLIVKLILSALTNVIHHAFIFKYVHVCFNLKEISPSFI